MTTPMSALPRGTASRIREHRAEEEQGRSDEAHGGAPEQGEFAQAGFTATALPPAMRATMKKAARVSASGRAAVLMMVLPCTEGSGLVIGEGPQLIASLARKFSRQAN
jgi:hypothetical protein